MATSTLLHTGEEPPEVGRGHGTDALGPSDTSDSGSDVQGGPGLARELGVIVESGSTTDPDHGRAAGAGPDIGDADLDSDTDSRGTGERAAAGRDATAADGMDISVDRIVDADEIGVTFSADAEIEEHDVEGDGTVAGSEMSVRAMRSSESSDESDEEDDTENADKT